MAIKKQNMIDVEIKGGGIHRSFVNSMIGEGDTGADEFGIRMFSDGTPVILSGASCIGYFIRPDGITLVIAGTVNGNEAYVQLPEAAYAKEGKFTLTIKVIGTEYADTMRIVDGSVVETTTGEISDPESNIPSLEELLAIIDQAEEAADEINALAVTATQITGTRYKISVTKGS